MGKVISILPELSEEQAKKILDNVSNAVCQPFPKAQAIVQEIEFLAYRFNRNNGLSASDLRTLGFAQATKFEVMYLEERLEATGGSDE